MFSISFTKHLFQAVVFLETAFLSFGEVCIHLSEIYRVCLVFCFRKVKQIFFSGICVNGFFVCVCVLNLFTDGCYCQKQLNISSCCIDMDFFPQLFVLGCIIVRGQQDFRCDGFEKRIQKSKALKGETIPSL